MARRVPRLRLGLAGRLFAAQALVVLAGSVTLGLVAAAVGPAIFHDHLRRKLGDDPTAPRFVRTVRGIGYRMGTG